MGMAAQQLNVTESVSGQLTVMSLTGEFDLAQADPLRKALYDACARGGHTTVLDFAGVSFIDSVILGVLVAGAKRATAAGTRLLIVNASGLPLRVLELTGLTGLFEINPRTGDLDAELAQLIDAQASSDS
jgi:anti-sigma B factor antagonist